MSTLNSAGRWIALPFMFLAFLVQANAVVRSFVMQAAPMAAPAICSAGIGRGIGEAERTGFKRHAKAPQAACPYCELATHAPVLTATDPVSRCDLVSFADFESFRAFPLREPLEIVARARDPPPIRQD